MAILCQKTRFFLGFTKILYFQFREIFEKKRGTEGVLSKHQNYPFPMCGFFCFVFLLLLLLFLSTCNLDQMQRATSNDQKVEFKSFTRVDESMRPKAQSKPTFRVKHHFQYCLPGLILPIGPILQRGLRATDQTLASERLFFFFLTVNNFHLL